MFLLCLLVDPGAMLLRPVILAGGVILLVSPTSAGAQSGGYSRPTGSAGSYASQPRRPSASGNGGYRRPSASQGSSYSYGQSSAGDRALSRQNSGQALRDYRAFSQPAPQAVAPPAAPPSQWNTRRPDTGYGPDWASVPRRPAASRGQNPSLFSGGSGALNAVMLWSMLNALQSSPGNASVFRDSRRDPAYAQWRAEADSQATRDPAVAQKLAQLDQAMAQPAAPAPASSGNSGLLLVLLVGGAVFAFLWYRRSSAASSIAAAPTALSGSNATRFRVGMTMPLDPTPFVLAAGATKIIAPTEGGLVSIEAVGLLRDGQVDLHRLWLPGRGAFFQLHLGADGNPDECRYFSVLDQVAPGSAQEWAFWLDPINGMIGWPQFQTKDGKNYDRVWAPGDTRVAPRQQTETILEIAGTSQRQVQAMLYGGPTGLARPAPATEYILVSAIEQTGQAWVEVFAGIDINPASLTLPSRPIS